MFWKIRYKLEIFIDKLLFKFGKLTNGYIQLLLFKLSIKLPSRYHILLLVKALSLKGKGAEIGVFEGSFSKRILDTTNLEILYCIDPWLKFSDNQYQDAANDSQEIQDIRFEKTKNKLKIYNNRVQILRLKSDEAANQFADNYFDFIYIDANHSYEGCKEDLRLWWPKLKSNGLMAGDDFTNLTTKTTSYGVEKAVREFFKDKANIYITYKATLSHWPNWYVIKN